MAQLIGHGQDTKRIQNAFNVTMDPALDIPSEASCTTCTFTEDFSNYWTPAMYFRARNGTFKRVPQMANQGFNGAVSTALSNTFRELSSCIGQLV